MTTAITKEFSFSYGHLLPNHSGKCRYLHGHNARLFVTVSGPISTDDRSPSEGMVIDFGELKTIVNQEVIDVWDHRFLACGDEWVVEAGQALSESTGVFNPKSHIVYVGVRSTAENLARLVYEKIQPRLASVGIQVSLVRFYETETSYADYVPEA